MTAAAAVGLFVLSSAQSRRDRALIITEAAEREELYDKLVELRGEPLKMIAQTEYTLWDEMVNFVVRPDSEWAVTNIDFLIDTYHFSAAWVLRPDLSSVYVSTDSASPELGAILAPEQLRQLFAQSHFCHFFQNTPYGPIEIQGGSIHPTNDIRRETPARGYLLVAQLWNPAALKDLGKLLGGKIKSVPGEGVGAGATGIDPGSGDIRFGRLLRGWEGKPVAQVLVHVVSDEVRELGRATRQQFLVLTAFIVVVLLVSSYTIGNSVIAPLKLLTRSLDTHDRQPIEPITAQKTEFGDLARLIVQAFEQRAALEREIAQRAQTEQALQESESRYKLLTEQTLVGVFVADLDSIRYANPACADILGYRPEELIGGIAFLELVHPDDRNRTAEHFRRGLDGLPENVQYQCRMRHHSGSIRNVELLGNRIRYEGKSAILGTMLDVTERVHAEAALHESELRLRNLVENLGEGIVRTDTEERFVFVNSAAAAIFGLTPDELVGRQVTEFLNDSGRAAQQEQTAQRRRGERGRYDLEIRRLDGASRVITVTATPEYDDEGSYAGAFAVLADITEARRIETELSLHRQHLEELVEERTGELQRSMNELRQVQAELVRREKLATLGQIAGSIAHELRNPLGIVRNAAYFLRTTQQETLTDKGMRHLEIMDTQIERADRIIASLLDYARGRPIERAFVPLALILDAALADLTRPANVTLVGALPPDLPALHVDRTQIQIVLRNLILNAIQAMPDGGTLTITAQESQEGRRKDAGNAESRTSQDRGPRRIEDLAGSVPSTSEAILRDPQYCERSDPASVSVSISDTGCGIAPEHQARLFEPLFSTKTIGVGLGLATSRSFVEANGGTIRVASQPGRGSTFTLVLPCAESGISSTDLTARPRRPQPDSTRGESTTDGELPIHHQETGTRNAHHQGHQGHQENPKSINHG